jgi:hypothetical protein
MGRWLDLARAASAYLFHQFPIALGEELIFAGAFHIA